MNHEFDLPVYFKNRELIFPARLLNYGYIYKLEVDVDGIRILFEPDEERNWRASMPLESINTNKKIDVDFLKAIASSIETILK